MRPERPLDRAAAEALEARLAAAPGPIPDGFELRLGPGGLALVHLGEPGTRPLRADPAALDTRSGPGRSLKSPLARAAGLGRGGERPAVADATGGLGEDAWLLAAAGCRVQVIERHPVVAALLEDGLARAAGRDSPARDLEIAGRVRLLAGEARELLPGLQPPPALVVIDPMFPARPGHAREKKAMRWLRKLAGEDADSGALLEVARRTATERVIVKRPRRAPPLAPGVRTTHAGKAIRWDVYGSRS